MAKFPILFCQSFADLVEQKEKERERSANATTVVHLDNGSPQAFVSLSAPAGMSEQDVRAEVQKAVTSAANYDDIPARLAGVGFEQIEHITINLSAPPGDDLDEAFDSAPR